MHAITNAVGPVFLSSEMSVSRPARNISIITPISEAFKRKSVSSTKPNMLGPSIMPANRAPTT